MEFWIVFLVPAVILVSVVLPLWLVFHYITKWREQKRLHSATEQDMQDLWRTAEKLERRLSTLETAIRDDPTEARRRDGTGR